MKHRRFNRSRFARRRGSVLGLTAVLMIVLIAFLAMAIDIGYLYTMRAELQRAADSAAIAATWELIDKNGKSGTETADSLTTSAQSKAVQFAALNKVGNAAPGLAGSDVVVGYMSDPSDPTCPLIATPSGLLPNAVQVRVQRTGDQNGQVPLFFARAIGASQQSLTAQGTAAFVNTFSGFKAPADGSNLNILPFALDLDTWNSLSASGTDSWSYDSGTGTVTAGGDGVKEVNLYPQGTGMPGNRGTVDLGSSNNSTADIARQIRSGISASDLSYLGGSIQFNSSGELYLNGDTGISAGVKDDLVSVIGKPNIIPIFNKVVGPGNNATYTIVKFVGVRVMDVKLTGSMASKAVMIQPCNVAMKGGIFDPNGSASQYVYSPVWLVR
jgi:Flp pilus assembly protein TadG